LNYLRSESYDLVISDVEMPEMDGFQLTARVKQDPNLSDIPVIIVSSLWSPEAKVRGMEAGAAAYIVKNRFDQQGLLATIRQLV
jgi:two-component system chemotaxis sensor kinase CheA